MRTFYLWMMVLGFAVPNYFVLRQSLETGNWLLWRNPTETSALAFHNFVSSAFVSDLFILLPLMLVWMLVETKRLNMRHVWVYLALSPLFGLSFTLPLFLYFRQGKLESTKKQSIL